MVDGLQNYKAHRATQTMSKGFRLTSRAHLVMDARLVPRLAMLPPTAQAPALPRIPHSCQEWRTASRQASQRTSRLGMDWRGDWPPVLRKRH
jgi:hypothetical protein